MTKKEIETFCPQNQADWRNWLMENHVSKQSIWLIYYKKETRKTTLTWSDAVDEALCFGWIDSTAKTIDEERYMQFFSKRKPNSVWSKVNKEKIERLMAADLIVKAGYDSIEIAKKNGSWTILDAVEALVIPEDLEAEFAGKAGSKDFFMSWSKSVRKAILQWLVLAKQPQTRQKRITEIVESASKNIKPKPF